MEQRDIFKSEKKRQLEYYFKEDARHKAERLYREFDTIRDVENAEKQMLILSTMKNAEGQVENERGYWLQYARFALRYGQHATAEYYIKKRYDAALQDELRLGFPVTRDRLLLASYYVQQSQFRQAQEVIQQIIQTDWKNI